MSAEVGVETTFWRGEDVGSISRDGKPALGSGDGRAWEGRGDGGGSSSFGVVGGSGGRLGVRTDAVGGDAAPPPSVCFLKKTGSFAGRFIWKPFDSGLNCRGTAAAGWGVPSPASKSPVADGFV